ncbi:nucleolar protein 58 [Cladophialophora bantiana CBS 173.52]|uniref:Nucleolar protein 58 n=1 Tax=Cladophialophora bantiana (strain ATCC 10958 / CBS 173.52 / CDC B-1940 / NIH 8579) TaxID=1442370 RepID=A0A0D2HLC8_CLAB1|nr:nucleolar protein 58 [Cladophialophora bantiana CBS 173.52]KIW94083.1 nucleolar protein 58 [Cladophialophora bantiana CBS 173.52]
MTLLILTETSAGYALLKAKDKKLLKRDDLASELSSVENVTSMLKLKEFQKFDSAAAALEEAAAIVEGKVTPKLSSLLNTLKEEKKISLAVADPKLGNAIGKIPGLEIKAVADSTTADLYRAIREYLPSLIPGLLPEDVKTMSLGLSHSLARHKLKFSPDKIDVMIVQAIGLLDDLDKELNTYAMRVKEWYGWHFPEMAKILNDNLAYAKVVLKMGMRTNWENCDLAEILPEEIEAAVKAAADRSMGTEITDEDLENIQSLAEQVVQFTEYRTQLASYLSARMMAIAPNLTTLVGDLVGARLIAHAGSLMNLSKSPASTIQILGAEKALFRALKTKHDTPKYGLIYHASLIGQATGRNKGKMARVLAAKAALGLRVDALQDWGDDEVNIPEDEKAALGLSARANLERKLAAMEGKPLKPRGVAIGPNGVTTTPQPKKWEIKEARKYNPDADGLAGDEAPAKEQKESKKEKKLVEEIPEDASMKEDGEGDNDEAESQSDESIASAEVEAIVPSAVNGVNGLSKKEAKKAAKERKRAEKAARKAAKKEKKVQAEKAATAGHEDKIEALAAQCGLSVERYKRKLARGEIQFQEDGTVVAVSKKEAKKARKAAEKAAAKEANGEIEGSKKRKRVEDEADTSKSEKKKKRKEKA